MPDQDLATLYGGQLALYARNAPQPQTGGVWACRRSLVHIQYATSQPKLTEQGIRLLSDSFRTIIGGKTKV